MTLEERIAQYQRLYRALLGRSGSPGFVRKMCAALSGLVKERGRLPHGPDASAHSPHSFYCAASSFTCGQNDDQEKEITHRKDIAVSFLPLLLFMG